MILAIDVRSGRMPYSPCPPPIPRRSAITSPQIRRTPRLSVSRRSARMNWGSAGIMPATADRLDNDRGQFGAMRLEHPLHRGDAVEAHHHRVQNSARMQALAVGSSDGVVGIVAGGGRGLAAHGDIVVRTMVGAFELGDLGAPGESARSPHCAKNCLAAGIVEHHALDRGHAPLELLASSISPCVGEA